MIGPVHPTFWLSSFFADAWMLFPTEQEYLDVRLPIPRHLFQQLLHDIAPEGSAFGAQWFAAAGFQDVKIKRIGPKWYRGVRRHGLIMGCSVTGIKPKVGHTEATSRCSHLDAAD